MSESRYEPTGLTTEEVASKLLASYEQAPDWMQHINSYELPSIEEVARFIEQCRALVFPGFVGKSLAHAPQMELRDYVRERVDEMRYGLRKQLYRGLHHKRETELGTRAVDCPECAAKAQSICDRFLSRLVPLREALALDVEAHFAGDPSASGTEEVIFSYPGVYAISVYRIAHALYSEGAKIIPRIMSELAHRETGIDIHPGAEIGEAFFIDHGTGTVIGETTRIGSRVRIYQGVTLGALSVPRGQRRPCGRKRHPSICDDVVIYSGATILGGDTVVGEGAVIGGNCWVTSSVPAGATVTLEGVRLGASKGKSTS